MPQVASITINDGQATPVAVTFQPEAREDNQVYSFVDRTPGTPVGYRRLKLGSRPATKGKTVQRQTYTIELPVTKVVDGVTVLSHTLRMNIEEIIPDIATDAQVKDLYAFAYNGLAHATVIKPVMQTREAVWG